ncbi:hypothetical protein P7K49_038612 [Saguinus oedipus]|uniref:Uncharacterized protein n=1 Tax=Saguinus oedipus TaxID=9490 RepID=A0ABQ9TF82_SAGOE|nr:hypothetical protein P7K49_038612 [Saguinus oedipus]
MLGRDQCWGSCRPPWSGDPRDRPVDGPMPPLCRLEGVAARGGRGTLLEETLKDLDECYNVRRDTDGRALIRSQDPGDQEIQIVSQRVGLVESRTRQVDSHVEPFEAQQEQGDAAGDSAGSARTGPEARRPRRRRNPTGKRSRRQHNNENCENASSNRDHDVTSATPKEMKAEISKKQRSLAQA